MKPAMNPRALIKSDKFRVCNEEAGQWVESQPSLERAAKAQDILSNHATSNGRKPKYSLYESRDGIWALIGPVPKQENDNGTK